MKKKYFPPRSCLLLYLPQAHMAKRSREDENPDLFARSQTRRRLNADLALGPEVERPRSLPLPDIVPQPIISNVVSTFKSSDGTHKLNLLRFSQVYGFEFQPSRFAACSIRIRDVNSHARSTALAFTSGKFVITGCRSEQESLLCSRRYIYMLNRLGERLSFRQFVTQNIVSAVNVNHPLQLHLMQRDNTCEMAWEQRKFPGLVWRDQRSKLVLLCFRSGRIVITGAKSKRQIDNEWPRLFKIIWNYIDTDKNATKCSRDYATQLRRDQELTPFEATSLF